MPLYLLQCKDCGHKFEKLTSFAGLEKAVCEKCGGEVVRVYDGAGVFGGSSVKESAPQAPCAGSAPAARTRRDKIFVLMMLLYVGAHRAAGASYFD